MKPEGGYGGASFPPPSAPVSAAIVGICVVVQVAMSFGGAAFADLVANHAALIPARVTGFVPSRPGDVPASLTLVTSLFLHGGWVHLGLNLLFLLWVGRNVEIVIGRARFVLLYLLGGLAGGLLQVGVAPHSLEPVIGASGAIAGVFGTYALLFARSRAAARRIFGIPISAGLATALWYAATWVVLQLLTALAFNGNGGDGEVAIWAHIGGFVTGLILAQPLARRRA